MLYFCIRFTNSRWNRVQRKCNMTELTQILTVALAAAFVVVVMLLVLAVIYYRWRLRDSHRTLARFIKENIELKSEELKSEEWRMKSEE